MLKKSLLGVALLAVMWTAGSGLAGQDATPSLLDERWAVGKDGTHRVEVVAYKPSYLLPGRWSDRPNVLPETPTQASQFVSMKDTEAKFQISLKFMVASFAEDHRLALWGAYTQQSHWQVYNAEDSRPFRETNYEPELFLAWMPDFEVMGMRCRLLTFGLDHQSNGRSDPLSRSWNRWMMQVGLERGNLVLLVRPWLRIPESRASDNNPDIEHYLGHGELVAAYRIGRQTLTATCRLNASSGKGSFQGTWSFPIQRKLKGYVQVFSGYGESMIDYNWRQNTVGIGFCLSDWF